jgi:outer membrane protein insertion porin family
MGGESDIRGYDIRSISPVTFIPEQTAAPVAYHDPNCGGCVQRFTIPTLIYVATLPGGDLQGYSNMEYRIPIVGNIVQTAFFLDAGTTGVLRRSALELADAGFQNLLLPQNFPHAQLPPPFGAGLTQQLPLAPGTNFRWRGSTGIEFVVQLPIIQAPFRIYYAYNVHRLYQELVAQNPYIDPVQICEPGNGALKPCPPGVTEGFYPATLPPQVWEFEVKPALAQLLNNPGRLNYFEPKTTFRFTVSRTF